MQSRRSFLLLGASLPLASLRAFTLGDAKKELKPWSWQDALNRSEIDAVVFSATGACAVQVTRPLNGHGVFGGFARHFMQPRGTLWLKRGQSNPVALSVRADWIWGPCFSPRGTRLAALTSKGDGKVGLAVWDIAGTLLNDFSDINLALFAKFSCDDKTQWRPTTSADSSKSFAWIDEDHLIALRAGDQEPQYEIDVSGASDTYLRLWKRTAMGRQSVREWGRNSELCGANRAVMLITCSSGRVELGYRGAINGVSISPGRRWIAALAATAPLQFPGDRPMPPSIGDTAAENNPLVSLKLVLIDLQGKSEPRDIPKFPGVGAVGAFRLPVWSEDSMFFAIPTRSVYSNEVESGSDACCVVEVSTAQARIYPATNPLDAEFLAKYLMTQSDQLRPSEFHPAYSAGTPDALSIGDRLGGAWRCKRQVVIWDGKTIDILSGSERYSVPGKYSSVYEPVACTPGFAVVAVRDDRQIVVIKIFGAKVKIEQVPAPRDAQYMGLRPTDLAVSVKIDDGEGSRVDILRRGARGLEPVLKFNQYLTTVRPPSARELFLGDSRKLEKRGILLLPPFRTPKQKHPVILWAYPNYLPSIGDQYTRVNSVLSVWYPLQYLLTRGYAVFLCPLVSPMEATIGPMRHVADQVLGWLDILNDQEEVRENYFGFFGHSNAGYVALALESLSNRFRAIVAYATFPDLGLAPLSGVPDKATLDCGGEMVQADRVYYEDLTQPYSFGHPFWAREDDFLRNSPVYHMESASTPLLLLQPEFDYGGRAMEGIYSILRGRGVAVELAMYWGEGHVVNSPGNLKDIWDRTERFFSKYLAEP